MAMTGTKAFIVMLLVEAKNSGQTETAEQAERRNEARSGICKGECK